MAKIKSDIELGDRLGVAATPSVFLDGRRLKHKSSAALELLINNRLESARP